jgi:hypothetical protein
MTAPLYLPTLDRKLAGDRRDIESLKRRQQIPMTFVDDDRLRYIQVGSGTFTAPTATPVNVDFQPNAETNDPFYHVITADNYDGDFFSFDWTADSQIGVHIKQSGIYLITATYTLAGLSPISDFEITVDTTTDPGSDTHFFQAAGTTTGDYLARVSGPDFVALDEDIRVNVEHNAGFDADGLVVLSVVRLSDIT